MRKTMVVAAIVISAITMTSCGYSSGDYAEIREELNKGMSEAAVEMSEAVSDFQEDLKEESYEWGDDKEVEDMFSLNSSSDKHTQYVDKYVGMNAASVGYTSLGGDRFERVGAGLLKITYVTGDGSYVGADDEDSLKEYVVTAQSIEPNTEISLEFEKDSNGEEYDNLIDHQSYEKIDLLVKKVGSGDPDVELVEIKPSPDKYTYYIQNYVGKNVLSIGYESLGGDYRDEYGNGTLELKLVSDDGSYIDVSDKEALRQYVVTEQNIAPNSELTYTFMKDSNGEEYSNLVDSQSYDSITLKIKKITE